jgi:hypothetical protein
MQNLPIDFSETRTMAFRAPTLDFEPTALFESVVLRAAFRPTSNPKLRLEMPATLCPEEYGLNDV